MGLRFFTASVPNDAMDERTNGLHLGAAASLRSMACWIGFSAAIAIGVVL